jgi:hypothetical protein
LHKIEKLSFPVAAFFMPFPKLFFQEIGYELYSKLSKYSFWGKTRWDSELPEGEWF